MKWLLRWVERWVPAGRYEAAEDAARAAEYERHMVQANWIDVLREVSESQRNLQENHYVELLQRVARGGQ